MQYPSITSKSPDELRTILVSDFVARRLTPRVWFVYAIMAVARGKHGGNAEEAFQSIRDEVALLAGRDLVAADIDYMSAAITNRGRSATL